MSCSWNWRKIGPISSATATAAITAPKQSRKDSATAFSSGNSASERSPRICMTFATEARALGSPSTIARISIAPSGSYC